MDPHTASQDLAFLRSVLERTQRRLDPHAFHFVSWGAIVLVWYPLVNAMELAGVSGAWQLCVGVAALALGTALSCLGERRLARAKDAPPEDEAFGKQVGLVVWGSLGPAIAMSVLGPALDLFPGDRVPIVWGLAYAAMAWMMGVVYSAEFRWGAVLIFAGSVAAMALPQYAGLLLGPTMGLGMIVPGRIAERRARSRRVEAGAATA